jgi:hypothetical protein
VDQEADDGAAGVASVLARGDLLPHALVGAVDLRYHVVQAYSWVAEGDSQGLAFGSCWPGLDVAEDVVVRSVDPVPYCVEMDVVVVAADAVVAGEVSAAVACSDQDWVDSQTVGLVDYLVA